MKLIHEETAVKLYHGDALHTPIDIRADGFMIDPPYARGGGVHNGRTSVRGLLSEEMGADQFWAHWFRDVALRTTAAVKPTGHGFICCDEDTYPLIKRVMVDANGWRVTQAIVWDRESIGMGSPFRASYEMIAFARGPDFKWTGSRSLSSVIRCRWPYGQHENHDAEKPVELFVKLMTEYSDIPAGGLWLDNFAGCAPVLRAAKRCGRRAVGIEGDEDRIAGALRLIREEGAQGVLGAVAQGRAQEPVGPLFGGPTREAAK